MGVAGGVGWLEALTTPNADVERVREVIDARGLHVPTLLDELARQWRQGNEKTRRVLLLAHAGDGKTEFIGRATAGLDVRVFDNHPGVPRWAEAGRWVMNDPSQLPTERVVAFLNAAFGDDGEGVDASDGRLLVYGFRRLWVTEKPVGQRRTSKEPQRPIKAGVWWVCEPNPLASELSPKVWWNVAVCPGEVSFGGTRGRGMVATLAMS